MRKDEKRALIERYLAAYNSLDVDGMLAVLHEEIEFENVSDGEVTVSTTGKSEFRRLAEQSRDAFSSRRQTMTSFADVGAGATIEVQYNAVLAADLPNGMKKGQVLDLVGRSAFIFQDGLIRQISDRI